MGDDINNGGAMDGAVQCSVSSVLVPLRCKVHEMRMNKAYRVLTARIVVGSVFRTDRRRHVIPNMLRMKTRRMSLRMRTLSSHSLRS